MRVRVDPDVCQGHGLCYFTAPDLFALSPEDGRASVALDPVPDDLVKAARQAVASCPEQAIAIVED
jgi:ferredoxin